MIPTSPTSTIADTQDLNSTTDASRRRSGIWVKLALITSTIWGLILIALFVFFFFDKRFKNYLLDFSQQYGSITFPNVCLMIIIETVFLMVGFSAAIPEICYAFFLKNYLAAFLIIAVARQLATIFAYFIGKYIFKEALDQYMKKYKLYICLKNMLKTSPYKTISIIRFSMMPNFVKYYGLPALDPPFWKLNIFVVASTLVQSHCYLLLGYFARSQFEIKTGTFSNPTTRAIAIACGIFYVVMLFALFFVIYKEMKKLEKKNAALQQRLIEQEDKNLDESTARL